MDGTPFGRYRLVELLGRGGMGEVWRAYDTVTDRVVALKVLPANFADDETFQERFRREARVAAGLDEPHVVPIYDFGEIDGRLYVTMRLINGRELQALLADGPLPPQRAVAIIEQVASALHAAHSIGLVHRDVKPSNILVAADDFTYLIDFGIARAVNETSLTSTGTVVGTWAYMAPERLNAGHADARSDIYALACVLHEALTGRRPYPGASLEQQIVGHLSTPPPRPSTLQPAVPEYLDAVIATGMAKDPGQRYATTKDLADAARRALHATPYQTGPPQPSGIEHLATAVAAPSRLAEHPQAATVPYQGPVAASPVPDGQNRGLRRPHWLIIGGAAAALVVAITAVVIVSAQHSTTTPTSPTTSQTPTPGSTVAADGLDSLLLTATQVNELMGTTTMRQQGSTAHTPQTALYKLSNPNCAGSFNVGQSAVYQGSGYTAFILNEFDGPGSTSNYHVTQAVAAFATAESAVAFLERSAAALKACAGQKVIETNASGQGNAWTIEDAVEDTALTITQLSRPDGYPGVTRQRAMRAVSNIVVDTMSAGPDMRDQVARRIADQIAANAKG